MIDKDQMAELKKTVDVTMAELIRDIPKTIKARTNGAIAHMFGFENADRGKWRVDHCNSRQSEISRWISDRAKKELISVCDQIITKSFIEEMIKEARPALEREFREHFNRILKQCVKEMAEKHVKEEINKHAENFLATMSADLDDIAKTVMSSQESLTQMAILESEIENQGE